MRNSSSEYHKCFDNHRGIQGLAETERWHDSPGAILAFSKMLENHRWAVALHFIHSNFCRVHQALRVTSAMEAGIANHVCSIKELVARLDVGHD